MQKTKICSHCLIKKCIDNFYKSTLTSDGFQSWCKDCIKELSKNNRPKYKKYMAIYHQQNKEKSREYKRKLHLKSPWIKCLSGIQQRCENPNNDSYEWYGGKGNKCLITKEEIK